MKEKSEITATLGGAKFGTSLKDLEEGDLSRGYFAAAPEGNYEGSLDGDTYYTFDDEKMTKHDVGTLHAGMIEADGYRSPHGADDEYGFVRRPRSDDGGDVERN